MSIERTVTRKSFLMRNTKTSKKEGQWVGKRSIMYRQEKDLINLTPGSQTYVQKLPVAFKLFIAIELSKTHEFRSKQTIV